MSRSAWLVAITPPDEPTRFLCACGGGVTLTNRELADMYMSVDHAHEMADYARALLGEAYTVEVLPAEMPHTRRSSPSLRG